MGQRRYPGATPFRKDQAGIFYGRDRDIEKMLTLIQVEKKVLLYSKSGLGKTSLLEAGIIPRLPENFVPVSIRFYAHREDSISPVERVIDAVKNALGHTEDFPESLVDHLDPEGKPSLWQFFKKIQLSGLAKTDEGDDKIFFLVFDQFEELFSYPPQQKKEFKNQFYELTEQKVPDRYAQLIAGARRSNRELFNREALGLLHKRVDVKTVFAIRSDRLSLLNELSDKITDIQNVFYEIKALDETQARQAIINPAKDPDPSFETRPYTFHRDAVDSVISKLTDEGEQSIESTQLQIVCHRIEEIAEEKSKTQEQTGEVVIYVKDLPLFRDIFLDFYRDSIDKIPETKRAQAKRLIEDELIRNGQRISLDENICKDYLDEGSLKTLVDTHLLRSERNNFGRFSFEVSHDTLVEPILESRKIYQEELEKKRQEEKRQEELLRLRQKQELEKRKQQEEMERMRVEQERKEQEKARKLRIQRIISAIVTVFLLVAVVLGIWGFRNFCDASRQRDKALVKEQEANKNLIDFKNAQFQDYFENGNDAKQDARYDLAIRNYNLAKDWIHADISISITDTGGDCNIFSEIFSNRVKEEKPNALAAENRQMKQDARADSIQKLQQVNDSIQRCRTLLSNAEKINELLGRASELLRRKQYVEALELYRQAYREDPNQQQNRRKFLDARSQAVRMYEKNIRDYTEIGDSTEVRRADSLLKLVRYIQP